MPVIQEMKEMFVCSLLSTFSGSGKPFMNVNNVFATWINLMNNKIEWIKFFTYKGLETLKIMCTSWAVLPSTMD